MAVRRVTSPDGREWEVRGIRVRFPKWRPSDFDPREEACGEFALPFALLRSLFSRTRWIEAETRWPASTLVRWRTTAARGETAVAEVAGALSRGYDVKVKDAELESMTEPPGFRDLDS